MHYCTYGLSDGKVGTTAVDIVVILDKVARADVIFVSQTMARLVRGGCVERALGRVLSRAHRITGWEGPAVACCHTTTTTKKESLVSYLLLFPRSAYETNVQSTPGFRDCIVD